MSNLERAKMLELIEQNVQRHGFHLYIVTGGCSPRFAYTIGLRRMFGAELVLAGGIYYTADEVKRMVDTIHQQLGAEKKFDSVFLIAGLGSFTLRKAHSSWVRSLLLGALDYYSVADVNAYQIVPDEAHWTIDTPDLREEWSAEAQPIWRWLHKEWSYGVPPKSTATTNLEALRGARITEATRWEEDQWEMFAGPGPEVSFEQARIVPLGTLVAADPSLSPVMNLEIGKGLWREPEGDQWHPWSKT
jgi:hypothetical protein